MRRVLFLLLLMAVVPFVLTTNADAAPPDPPEKLPVVLVPGAGDVIDLPPSMGIEYLEENGYKVFLAPFGYNNLQNAYILASTVQKARRLTGAPKVHIFALSMGGLPALYYQKVLGGSEYVETWTGLDVQTGSQSVGVDLKRCANLLFHGGDFFGHACTHSRFMKAITEGDPTPGPTFYAVIQWQVDPPDWPGDCIINLPPSGHLEPYFLPDVIDGVIATFSHRCPTELEE
jgi:hypothetical protein